MPNESPPSTVSVERFLSALAEVHPVNVMTVAQSVIADPSWLGARNVVDRQMATDAPLAQFASGVAGRVREIAAAAAARGGAGAEATRPTVGEIEGVLLGATHALIARGALERSGDGPAFAALYRPFEGMIPLDMLSAGGDEERERLVGGEGPPR